MAAYRWVQHGRTADDTAMNRRVQHTHTVQQMTWQWTDGYSNDNTADDIPNYRWVRRYSTADEMTMYRWVQHDNTADDIANYRWVQRDNTAEWVQHERTADEMAMHR